MKASILFGLLIIVLSLNASAATGFTYTSDFVSELPILLLNANAEIPGEDKVIANFTVIYNGNPNYFDGLAEISIHGASSRGYLQKSISVQTLKHDGTDYKFPFFGLPKGEKWILANHYNDRTLMRNAFSYELYSRIGKYSPRYKHCEVFLNNQYAGVYLFVEKIMQGKDRVNISKLKESDVSGYQLTGGYIWKFDVDNFTFFPSYPSEKKINEVQYNYLFRDYLPEVFKILWSANDTTRTKIIDDKSFIDYFLFSELSANVDAYKKSRYFYKDRDDVDPLIYAGPVWDFDWAWKYIWTEGIPLENNGLNWMYKHIDPCCHENRTQTYNAFFWRSTEFAKKTRDQWFEYRQNVYSESNMISITETFYQLLSNSGAARRHFELYPLIGQQGHSIEKYRPLATTYRGEVDNLQTFISERINFMDHNISSALNV